MSIENLNSHLKLNTKVDGTTAKIEFEDSCYVDSLKASDLTEAVVKAVRQHDKTFVASVTGMAGKEMVNIFKKHKDVTEGITSKVSMLGGNSTQVTFDRVRDFNNPKTGETVTRHVYSTVKVKDSSASNSELRRVRDEIMEAGLKALK